MAEKTDCYYPAQLCCRWIFQSANCVKHETRQTLLLDTDSIQINCIHWSCQSPQTTHRETNDFQAAWHPHMKLQPALAYWHNRVLLCNTPKWSSWRCFWIRIMEKKKHKHAFIYEDKTAAVLWPSGSVFEWTQWLKHWVVGQLNTTAFLHFKTILITAVPDGEDSILSPVVNHVATLIRLFLRLEKAKFSIPKTI